jgi:hypothetical protein
MLFSLSLLVWRFRKVAAQLGARTLFAVGACILGLLFDAITTLYDGMIEFGLPSNSSSSSTSSSFLVRLSHSLLAVGAVVVMCVLLALLACSLPFTVLLHAAWDYLSEDQMRAYSDVIRRGDTWMRKTWAVFEERIPFLCPNQPTRVASARKPRTKDE